MTYSDAILILAAFASVWIFPALAAWPAVVRERRRERIVQERHDANARTMAHIEAVRRGE